MVGKKAIQNTHAVQLIISLASYIYLPIFICLSVCLFISGYAHLFIPISLPYLKSLA